LFSTELILSSMTTSLFACCMPMSSKSRLSSSSRANAWFFAFACVLWRSRGTRVWIFLAADHVCLQTLGCLFKKFATMNTICHFSTRTGKVEPIRSTNYELVFEIVFEIRNFFLYIDTDGYKSQCKPLLSRF
jgi:hypothetical protein